jgi:hypothetical protein
MVYFRRCRPFSPTEIPKETAAGFGEQEAWDDTDARACWAGLQLHGGGPCAMAAGPVNQEVIQAATGGDDDGGPHS